MSAKVRPSGVTVLVVLEILGALAFLGGGAMFVVLSSFVAKTGGFGQFGGPLAALSSLLGGVLIVVGILGLVLAVGLWRGSGWAWTLGLILAGIGIILGLASLPSGIINIIIDAIIIYYLTRPHVRQFFRPAIPTPPSPTPEAPPA